MISLKNKLMIIAMMAAGFIGSLSQNLLTSALPSIMLTFNISAAVGQWLTTIYILVMGIITGISAYLFYRFKTKNLVQISLCLFLAGCLLALSAPNFPILLLARIIQACGAGPAIPLLQTAVIYIFPPEKQGQAIGLTGIIVGFAPAIGPTLSGILVDAFGWRSIFVFLIILCIIIIIIGQFTIHDVGERQFRPLETVSIILYSIGFSTFMLAVTMMKSGGFLQAKVLIFFCIGLLSLYFFVRRQFRVASPMLKLSLLKYRSLVLGIILLGTAYVLNMAGTILVPLFNQTLCSYSATVSGFMLLPGSLLIAILSPLSGHLMDRYGAKLICIAGMIFNVSGNLMFVFFSNHTSILCIITAYSLRCTGMTFLMTPSTALAVQDIPLIDKPHGMAILNSFRQMSGSLFSTVLVIIATICSAPESLNIHGMHAAFIVMTVLSLIGIGVSVIIPTPKRTK